MQQGDIVALKDFFLTLQAQICLMLEQEDGKAKFVKDDWSYPEGGGGLTCVLTDGAVFEKAAVNFSYVKGNALPSAATAKRSELAECPFQALGVSSVIHPMNPYVPTTHLNVRCIRVEKHQGLSHWWFGGGFDLTPYYGFTEDCIHWHTMAKEACDPYGKDVYPRFKKWCDEYFYLKHRQEARGIGGIFFDDLYEWGFVNCLQFVKGIGQSFIKAYQPIVAKRKTHAYGQQERDFQMYRRGRYVEFNLLYDRGTLFGLQSGGRTESILVSLPPIVGWKYDWKPMTGSNEARLYDTFLPITDWVTGDQGR